MPEMNICDENGNLYDHPALRVFSYMVFPTDEEQRRSFYLHNTYYKILRVAKRKADFEDELDVKCSEIRSKSPDLFNYLHYPFVFDPRKTDQNPPPFPTPDEFAKNADLIRESLQALVRANLAEQSQNILIKSDCINLLAKNPSTESLWNMVSDIVTKTGGMIGEFLLLNLLNFEHNPKWASVNRTKEILQEYHKMSISQIASLWSKYRSVAQLWLCLLLFTYQCKTNDSYPDEPVFGFLNLSGEPFIRFLSYSEIFRRQGEKIYAPLGPTGTSRSKTPLLTDTWRVPAKIDLPVVQSNGMPPLDEVTEKLYRDYKAWSSR